MTTLTVFYDGKCGLCHTCRRWLSKQPKFIELRFVPFQSEEALTLMPELMRFEPSKELVVLSDEGGVYVGDQAWIMCLYALVEYREWAQRLANPMMRPLAKRICQMVSKKRLSISRLMREVQTDGGVPTSERLAGPKG